MNKLKARMLGLYHKLASPKHFYAMSNGWVFPLAFLTSLLFFIGIVGALLIAPADYQQGEIFRIIYVHVPSAILAQSAYMLIASCGFVVLIWRIKMAAIVARSTLLLGACFAFLTLVTGAIWGKPTWGTYWLWGDARLMSSLFLLFLYLGMIALRESFQNEQAGIRASSFLALIGVVNIPVLKYSVYWWNSLHQPATLKLTEKPAIQFEMLWPLLAMIAAFYSFFILMVILRSRNEILHNERRSQWVRALVANESVNVGSQ